jgi:hypothetical protein
MKSDRKYTKADWDRFLQAEFELMCQRWPAEFWDVLREHYSRPQFVGTDGQPDYTQKPHWVSVLINPASMERRYDEVLGAMICTSLPLIEHCRTISAGLPDRVVAIENCRSHCVQSHRDKLVNLAYALYVLNRFMKVDLVP